MPAIATGLRGYTRGMSHVVVCGLGRFGLQVVESLRAAGAEVTVITDESTSDDRLDRVRVSNTRVVIGDFRFATARREADIAHARAVVITTASDVDNLEAALEIRGEAPGIPVVMRHSQPRLTGRFESDFGITAVLSPADLAADAFVAAAIESPSGEPAASVTPRRRSAVRRHRARADYVVIPSMLLALYLVAIVVFKVALGLTWLDAAYFATSVITTVGFGDFHLRDAPEWVKVFGIVLMFSGIVLVGMIASLLTIFVVSGAAEQLRNQFAARRRRDHVIVCGLGLVGVAVARDLCRRGIPVVGVDPDAHDDGLRDAHLRCPLIAGDATSGITLTRAGIDRARAVVACTSNDALNLEIGLTAQSAAEERRPDRPLRLVLRCFDADLARRIHSAGGNYTLLSEATIAAPVFVQRALG